MAENTSPEPARVVVIDDHTTFAELLGQALDREQDLLHVGHAGSAAAAVELCRTVRPDVVVMDYHLQDGNGLDAAGAILQDSPQIRIIVLTGNPTPEILGRAAGSGICGFLPKDGSLQNLLDAVRFARPGGMMIHPSLLAVQQAPPEPDHHNLLTARERQVLSLMAAGNDVRANARLLGISENTCRGYVKSILAKLGAHTQLEAVAIAQRRHLLPGTTDA
ncbi:response regulator [Arthrobacter mobilis]|uniref:Response regulator transcription factor n=1 Tax=Arthrobacter mobilis TaxID=2724944 RepID=A0A7X6K2J4_9MICC|nr:response regulator transcription factor [Arthrobacter mobilis]NKX53257.1 response regulator transcription factor [Arthrobacter mobilis]